MKLILKRFKYKRAKIFKHYRRVFCSVIFKLRFICFDLRIKYTKKLYVKYNKQLIKFIKKKYGSIKKAAYTPTTVFDLLQNFFAKTHAIVNAYIIIIHYILLKKLSYYKNIY